eukprot:359724-Chlamydomonas_euryale.AAC.1
MVLLPGMLMLFVVAVIVSPRMLTAAAVVAVVAVVAVIVSPTTLTAAAIVAVVAVVACVHNRS